MNKFLLLPILLFTFHYSIAQDPLTEGSGNVFKIKTEAEFLQIEQNLSPAAKTKLEEARRERTSLGAKAKYTIGANRVLEYDPQGLLGINTPAPISLDKYLERENRNKSIITNLGINFPQQVYDNIDLRSISAIGCYWDTSILTPVKDQNPCGSCWAFSAIANWEHAYRKLYGTDLPVPDLSEQEILDCATDDDGDDAGTCAGGYTDMAMQFMVRQAVAGESVYPYTRSEGACSRIPGTYRSYLYGQVLHVERSGSNTYLTFPKRDEIKAYIKDFGSVVTYMKAGTSSFRGYGGGILNAIPSDDPDAEENPVDVDHAVIIVGWCDDKNAWIIKNSWGEDWGPFGGYAYVDYDSYDIGKFVYYILPKSSQTSQREVPNLTDIGKSLKPDDLLFYGGQWGDQDDDGEDDLFIAGISQQQRGLLLRNDGAGGFRRASNSDYFFSTGRGFVWGDYNNDGKPDVFAPGGIFGVDSIQSAAIFKNTGTGKFQRIALPRSANHGTWADTDRDGDLDLIMDGGATDGNFLTLFRNDGGDVFTELRAFPGSTNALSFVTTAADLNNDRKTDIFSAGGSTRVLYIGSGDNTFQKISSDPLVAEDLSMQTRGFSFGDLDNDGDLDLVLLSTSTDQSHKIFLNNGIGSFQSIPVAQRLGSSIGGGRGSVIFDYDSDGFLDLFLTSGTSLEWSLFRNTGTGSFKKALSDPLPAGVFSGASVSDYNNDGKLDVFTAYFGAANNSLFTFGEKSNNWIQIRLFGRQTNRNAFNSTVDVFADGSRRHQQLLAVNGFANQNSMVLHFGLGTLKKVDSVVVNWTNGHRQVIYNPGINQKHLIRENLMSDRLANEYPTAVIAGREWITQNLRTTQLKNGFNIPEQQNPQSWNNLSTAAWTHYDNNAQFETKTGKLYNYFAVENQICPDGWLVPALGDWNGLINGLGGAATAAIKLKDERSWNNGTNQSRFTAVPSGKRTPSGEFVDFNTRGHWWSIGQTIYSLSNLQQETGIINSFEDKRTGASVRCIREQKEQKLEFKPIPSKVYGDPDFPIFINTSSGLPVKLQVSDTTVAAIIGSQVLIKSAGNITITAKPIQDPEFREIPAFVQPLLIEKAQLILKAEDKTMQYGDNPPPLTFTTQGFRYNETVRNLEKPPVLNSTATAISDVGSYEITLQNTASRNYQIQQVNGLFTISKATVTAQADGKTRKYGQQNPSLTITYKGFKNNQTSAVLDIPPIISTKADLNSDVGTYEITVSGGSDQNYAVEGKSGLLTIEKADQLITFNKPSDIVETAGSFKINATINSALPLSFSTTNTDKINISSSTVSILKPGRINIVAEQPGDGNHLPATSVSQNFCILPKQPVIQVTGLGTASIILSSSAETGNQWYLNGVAILKTNGFPEDGNKKELAGTEDGIYTVRSNADDCQGLLSEPLTLVTTGLSESSENQLISIFPNPATTELNVHLADQLRLGAIKVSTFDLLGNRINEISTTESSFIHQVGSLAPGNYILTFTAKSFYGIKRFVKK